MECSFYFEVIAPDGLGAIKNEIDSSGLGLYVYLSGFNNKCILKNRVESKIDIGMDTSTTDMMHASGYIEADFNSAKEMMAQLSEIFKTAGYPHKIGVDDENGENTVWHSSKYS